MFINATYNSCGYPGYYKVKCQSNQTSSPGMIISRIFSNKIDQAFNFGVKWGDTLLCCNSCKNWGIRFHRLRVESFWPLMEHSIWRNKWVHSWAWQCIGFNRVPEKCNFKPMVLKQRQNLNTQSCQMIAYESWTRLGSCWTCPKIDGLNISRSWKCTKQITGTPSCHKHIQCNHLPILRERWEDGSTSKGVTTGDI